MHIGMILCKPYPPDIRLEKEIRSLIEAGHHLFVLAERPIGGVTLCGNGYANWVSGASNPNTGVVESRRFPKRGCYRCRSIEQPTIGAPEDCILLVQDRREPAKGTSYHGGYGWISPKTNNTVDTVAFKNPACVKYAET